MGSPAGNCPARPSGEEGSQRGRQRPRSSGAWMCKAQDPRHSAHSGQADLPAASPRPDPSPFPRLRRPRPAGGTPLKRSPRVPPRPPTRAQGRSAGDGRPGQGGGWGAEGPKWPAAVLGPPRGRAVPGRRPQHGPGRSPPGDPASQPRPTPIGARGTQLGRRGASQGRLRTATSPVPLGRAPLP